MPCCCLDVARRSGQTASYRILELGVGLGSVLSSPVVAQESRSSSVVALLFEVNSEGYTGQVLLIFTSESTL